MIRKLIAIAAAIAINCAVLAWFHAWSSAAVASAAAASARMPTVVTLPIINVHPSANQLRQLHAAPETSRSARTGLGGGAAACLVMPYYSFASQCDATVSG